MPDSSTFNPDEEYYAEFKAMIRAKLPTGAALAANLRAAYDQFFKDEGIILSPREKDKLFQMILKEITDEMETK
jgi:hypothetical protein